MNDELRFILHIGRNKSGTSALQYFLHVHQAALKAQGFLYPLAGREQNIAHHALATALARPEAQAHTRHATLERFQQDLAAETAGWTGTVIISSESLQNVPPQPLTELFPVERTRVIVYLREQAEYVVSAYQQRVQSTDYSGTLSAYAADFGAGNYARFLKPWLAVFGRDNLIVARYDRSQLVDGDIIHDFCHRTGVPLLAAPPDEDRNPSIGGALLEIKRVSNALGTLEVLPGKVYTTYRRVALTDARFRRKPVLPQPSVIKLRQQAHAWNEEVSRSCFDGAPLFHLKPAAQDAAPSLPVSELCRAVASLLADNPAYGEDLLLRLIANVIPDPQRHSTIVTRMGARLAAGQTPRRLVLSLRELRHPGTQQPWVWNMPVDWDA